MSVCIPSMAPEQLRGIYDFAAYKALVADCGDMGLDVARTREYRDRMRDAAVAGNGSVEFALYEDAARSAAAGVARLSQGAIDTRDARSWLTLRDCVISATRLTLFPEYAPSIEVSVYELVYATCLMLDLMGRIADQTAYADALVSDVREANGRVAPMLLDIVCGRTAAWLAYIDDMGACASACSGGNWAVMRDGYAEARLAEMLGTVRETCGIADEQEAKDACAVAMLDIVGTYDDAQWRMMIDDTGAYSLQLDAASAIACLRDEEFATFSEALVMPETGVADLLGYCYTFAVSEVACVFDVPLTAEKALRRARAIKRSQEALR